MTTGAIILACMATVALAAPQGQLVQILSDKRAGPEGASYSYDFSADNGIAQSETGTSGSKGQANAQGFFSYPDENGNTIEIRYTADEFGFQPQGAHLPVPPPAPPHVAELLRIAEEQRAAGITFEK